MFVASLGEAAVGAEDLVVDPAASGLHEGDDSGYVFGCAEAFQWGSLLRWLMVASVCLEEEWVATGRGDGVDGDLLAAELVGETWTRPSTAHLEAMYGHRRQTEAMTLVERAMMRPPAVRFWRRGRGRGRCRGGWWRCFVEGVDIDVGDRGHEHDAGGVDNGSEVTERRSRLFEEICDVGWICDVGFES